MADFETAAEAIARDWWEKIAPIRTAIYDLAFIRSLADGTLANDPFVWYIAQDAVYVKNYSITLAAASKLAPTPAEQLFWDTCSKDAVATELELHAKWLPKDTMFSAESSPVTPKYVNHLLKVSEGGCYEELIAAVLPCFWIYEDVGSRLVQHAVPENPYAAWLKNYGDPAFGELNREAIKIVTTRAAGASLDTREKMWIAFELSSQYELEFFAIPLERCQSHPESGE
jgi:thiaminase